MVSFKLGQRQPACANYPVVVLANRYHERPSTDKSMHLTAKRLVVLRAVQQPGASESLGSSEGKGRALACPDCMGALASHAT